MTKYFKGIAFFAMPLFFLVGCHNQNSELDGSQRIKLVKTEIEIPHEDFILSNRLLFTKLIDLDKIVYFEYLRNEFYLFDLKNKKVSRILSFDSDGPNFMEPIVLDFEIVPQGYIILSQNYLHFSDKDSRIFKRININQFTDNFKSADFRVNRIQYNNDKLFMTKWIRSALYFNVQAQSKMSIFANLDLTTDSIIDIPIYSPEETLIDDPLKGYRGLSEHYFISFNDSIIFNFRFSPTVFTYDLKAGRLKRNQINSENVPNRRVPFNSEDNRNPEKLQKYLFNGTDYSNIAFDSKTGLMARVIANLVMDDSNNISVTKFLQVLSSDYKIVKELEIPERVQDKVFAANGVFYLIPSQNSEESTRFVKYEVELSK